MTIFDIFRYSIHTYEDLAGKSYLLPKKIHEQYNVWWISKGGQDSDLTANEILAKFKQLILEYEE